MQTDAPVYMHRPWSSDTDDVNEQLLAKMEMGGAQQADEISTLPMDDWSDASDEEGGGDETFVELLRREDRVETLECSAAEKTERPTVYVCNVLFLSSCFFLVYTALTAIQNYSSSLIHPIRIEGSLGNTSLGMMYLVYTMSCWISPAVVLLLGHLRAISIGFLVMTTYSVANIVVILDDTKGKSKHSYFTYHPREFDWAILMTASTLVGLAASFIWTAQGSYVVNNSMKYALANGMQPKARLGMFTGLFFAVFQLTQITGNLGASVLFEKLHFELSQIMMLYTAMAVLGTLLSLLLKPVSSGGADALGFSSWCSSCCASSSGSGGGSGGGGGSHKKLNRESPYQLIVMSVQAMTVLWTDWRMCLITPLMIYTGLEQGFIWGDFTTNFVKPSVGEGDVGYVMALFGIVDVIFSGLLGFLSDRFGRHVVFALGFGFHGCACAVMLWQHAQAPTPDDHAWWSLCGLAALWGVGDAAFNTQVMALVAELCCDREDDDDRGAESDGSDGVTDNREDVQRGTEEADREEGGREGGSISSRGSGNSASSIHGSGCRSSLAKTISNFAAFANLKLWQSLGITTAFFYTPILSDLEGKLMILLVGMLIGLAGYIVLTVKLTSNEASRQDDGGGGVEGTVAGGSAGRGVTNMASGISGVGSSSPAAFTGTSSVYRISSGCQAGLTNASTQRMPIGSPQRHSLQEPLMQSMTPESWAGTARSNTARSFSRRGHLGGGSFPQESRPGRERPGRNRHSARGWKSEQPPASVWEGLQGGGGDAGGRGRGAVEGEEAGGSDGSALKLSPAEGEAAHSDVGGAVEGAQSSGRAQSCENGLRRSAGGLLSGMPATAAYESEAQRHALDRSGVRGGVRGGREPEEAERENSGTKEVAGAGAVGALAGAGVEAAGAGVEAAEAGKGEKAGRRCSAGKGNDGEGGASSSRSGGWSSAIGRSFGGRSRSGSGSEWGWFLSSVGMSSNGTSSAGGRMYTRPEADPGDPGASSIPERSVSGEGYSVAMGSRLEQRSLEQHDSEQHSRSLSAQIGRTNIWRSGGKGGKTGKGAKTGRGSLFSRAGLRHTLSGSGSSSRSSSSQHSQRPSLGGIYESEGEFEEEKQQEQNVQVKEGEEGFSQSVEDKTSIEQVSKILGALDCAFEGSAFGLGGNPDGNFDLGGDDGMGSDCEINCEMTPESTPAHSRHGSISISSPRSRRGSASSADYFYNSNTSVDPQQDCDNPVLPVLRTDVVTAEGMRLQVSVPQVGTARCAGAVLQRVVHHSSEPPSLSHRHGERLVPPSLLVPKKGVDGLQQWSRFVEPHAEEASTDTKHTRVHPRRRASDGHQAHGGADQLGSSPDVQILDPELEWNSLQQGGRADFASARSAASLSPEAQQLFSQSVEDKTSIEQVSKILGALDCAFEGSAFGLGDNPDGNFGLGGDDGMGSDCEINCEMTPESTPAQSRHASVDDNDPTTDLLFADEEFQGGMPVAWRSNNGISDMFFDEQ
jgi:MFS family permease